MNNLKFSQWLAWRAQRKDMSDAVLYWHRAELAFRGSLDDLITQWLEGRNSQRVAEQVEAVRMRLEGPLTFMQYVERLAQNNATDGRLCVFARLLQIDRRYMRGSRKWQPIHNCLVNMQERRCIEYARGLWEVYAKEQGLGETPRQIAQRKMKKRLAGLLTARAS